MPKREKEPTDHAAVALQYAKSVCDGAIPAGRWVRAACQRQLADVKRTRWGYTFNAEAGARVCRFVENLPHTKGKWAAEKQKVLLQPWQCFLIVTGFGWQRRDNGKRRFRSFYWEIPRKNGKSVLGAGIGLYMLTADKEHGAEVYSGATSEKQALEVWRPAKQMMQNAPEFSKILGVEVNAKSLAVLSKGSRFEPIIGNPGDGASPSCAIIDEFHEHQTPALYDTMETGMGSREQPLMLVITTAGSNIAGPCYDKREQVCKVLESVVENEELFGCIYGLDEADDWADPKSLIKANPNYGVSVDGDFLQSQQRKAMQNPLEQNRFKTKHLNVWTSVYAGVMNMQQWALCADPMLEEEELAGADCWIAVDLASKSDLCAAQRLYRKEIAGRAHYYLFGSHWLPEEAVEEPGPNHAHYVKWRNKGLLTQTDGATVDFDLITETLIEDCKRINPQEVVFDPFNAVQMMQAMMRQNITAVEFIQTPQNFAVPLDELLSAVKDGRFNHDGNEITTWCVSNMVARPAKKGLVAPIKQKPHQKIDSAIAICMCMARASTAPTEQPDYQMLFV